MATIAKTSTVAPETSWNTRTSPTRSRYCGRSSPRSRLTRLRLVFNPDEDVDGAHKVPGGKCRFGGLDDTISKWDSILLAHL
ncbi:hypothetical protein [Bradyrhizobium sp.]|uniref:hypothetical protein n=1 Tax=Bradyrhizobium sp. TaxID=376 RepID=UPI003C78B20F